MAEKVLGLPQLNELCCSWQKTLGLENWEIKVKLSKQDDIGEGSQGKCIWTIKKRQATILILRHDNYPSDSWEQDMECTLVHELLHCMFAITDTSELNSFPDIILEQNIHQLSKTLVWLMRGAK